MRLYSAPPRYRDGHRVRVAEQMTAHPLARSILRECYADLRREGVTPSCARSIVLRMLIAGSYAVTA